MFLFRLNGPMATCEYVWRKQVIYKGLVISASRKWTAAENRTRTLRATARDSTIVLHSVYLNYGRHEKAPFYVSYKFCAMSSLNRMGFNIFPA